MKTGAVVVALSLLAPSLAAGQMAGGPPASRDEKIASAMRGGPPQITSGATLLAWPRVKGDKPELLRAGSNGWVCYARSRPEIDNAMCYDPVFQEWMAAIRTHSPLRVSRIGLAYLLAGGFIGSAADPYATGPTPTNDYGRDGPSMMILSPDPSAYAGLPTKRSAGPYVMYAGTPYAHIMVPVAANR